METNFTRLQSVATIEYFVQTEIITLKLIRFTRKELIHLTCIIFYIKVVQESYVSYLSFSRMFNTPTGFNVKKVSNELIFLFKVLSLSSNNLYTYEKRIRKLQC